MKHNQNTAHTHAAAQPLTAIRFEFNHPTAKHVALAGTFNDWNPESKSMHPSGHGHWLKETPLAPGTYQYCLVVDGHWMPDPNATESVPNPYGGRNSVLTVPAPGV